MGRLSKSARDLIQRWHPLLYAPGTDELWKQWLAREQHWASAFDDLVSGEFKPTIKARAILMLLTPRFDLIPFAGPLRRAERKNFLDVPPCGSLPAELLSFTADAIAMFYRSVGADAAARDAYHGGFIELLAQRRLPSEAKRSLLRHIPLHAVVQDPDRFGRLLAEKDIPEAIKRRADVIVRRIVMKERAIESYAEVIAGQLGGGYRDYFMGRDFGPPFRSHPPRYGTALFATQLRFLMQGFRRNKEAVSNFVPPSGRMERVCVIHESLPGADKKFRRSFLAWCFMHDLVRILSEQDLHLMEQLRAAYAGDRERDQQLGGAIERWYESQRRRSANEAARNQEKRNEEALYARMGAGV